SPAPCPGVLDRGRSRRSPHRPVSRRDRRLWTAELMQRGANGGKLIAIRVAYNPEAKVWWTESSEFLGLNACAPSLDDFHEILPGRIRDRVELNEPSWLGHDISVD